MVKAIDVSIVYPVAVVFVAHSANSLGCSSGMKLHGSSCYYFSQDMEDWIAAQQFCIWMGGHLAEVNDASEGSFLSSMAVHLKNGATHYDFWLGGRSDFTNGVFWVWYSNKAGISSAVTRWAPNEPRGIKHSGDYENCLELWDNGLWNDESCYKSNKYICEIPSK